MGATRVLETRVDIARCGKIDVVYSVAERWTGIGGGAGCGALHVRGVM